MSLTYEPSSHFCEVVVLQSRTMQPPATRSELYPSFRKPEFSLQTRLQECILQVKSILVRKGRQFSAGGGWRFSVSGDTTPSRMTGVTLHRSRLLWGVISPYSRRCRRYSNFAHALCVYRIVFKCVLGHSRRGLSHRKRLQSRFAKVKSRTNPSTYSLY